LTALQTNTHYFFALRKRIEACRLCEYGEEREKQGTRAVPGEGSHDTPVMFIGEAPGEEEARQGEPFVGRAGQYLTSLMNCINLPRARVFITNIVKCRPPNNETPKPECVSACLPYLKAQIALLKPRVIVLLGNTALTALLGKKYRLQDLRGKARKKDGIIYFVTYHPAAVLRSPNTIEPVITRDFETLKQLLQLYCPEVFL
jgi:uracil-DNA glycosylase family 4